MNKLSWHYKTKTNFTQVATTEDGYFAASTATGEIKLYDKLGKIAKTMLPAMGDDFVGLTTSTTGRFVLATCKNYLLLIDVQIKRGSNRWKLGYEKSFAKDSKPLPKKLALKPEHLACIRAECGHSWSFTQANFNVNMNSKNKNPTSIITSVGPFAITWNLRKALRNEPDAYRIRKYTDDVLVGDFTYSNVNRMVLTLPNDVTMVSTRQFKKAEQAFETVQTYK
ncbi:unnamed protein product [Ambrosiozyma monospora]|uniref:Unnamed protein product n=1 Tax=Ambrosiozyma monospora TaxID=43982 RepID=A0A9W7DI21_AMBMO|nr:unnamed protein product [Ambrosiozyma monospora]